MATINGILAHTGTPVGGYRVEVRYKELIQDPSAESDAGSPTRIPIPASKTATSTRFGDFSFEIPEQNNLETGSKIEIIVSSPDGEIRLDHNYEFTEVIAPEFTIEIIPKEISAITSNDLSEEVKMKRIRGKVVDIAGNLIVRNKQIIIWGKKDTASQLVPLVITTTDLAGNFFGDFPKGSYVEASATVAVDPSTPISIQLNTSPISTTPSDGTTSSASTSPPFDSFPEFLYLVLTVPADYKEPEDDCACNDKQIPRCPDSSDLHDNADVYSQDIGGSCVNLTIPNRALEEFSFYSIVRTTEPVIKGLSIADHENPRVSLPNEESAESGGGSSSPTSTPLGNPSAGGFNSGRVSFPGGSIPISGTGGVISSSGSLNLLPNGYTTQRFKNQLTSAAQSKSLLGLGNLLDKLSKSVPGRAELNSTNAIDWDGTPTFYQATTIAHGHILHFKQVWKADGYSMGDLLYSLPLAPGQKKNIAIFDWDRKEAASRTEDTVETEALNAYLDHARDIDDITNAALTENIKGGSDSSTSGSSGGFGAAGGIALLGGFLGLSGGFSSSSGSAASSSYQDSARNTSALSHNTLHDRTMQGASAVRSQRSTVITTVGQGETFNVTTETVQNNNHCHALTIEYFEILRHYCIEQKLVDVQECLFIPLLMAEFDELKTLRWRRILENSALIPRRIKRSNSFYNFYDTHPLLKGFDAIDRIINNYDGDDFPEGTYASENLHEISGELKITFHLNRPPDDSYATSEELRTLSPLLWEPYFRFFTSNISQLYNNYFQNRLQQERDRVFEQQIAPKIAQAFVNQLIINAVDSSGIRYPLNVDTTLISNYVRDVQLHATIRPTSSSSSLRRDQIEYIEIVTTNPLPADSSVMLESGTIKFRTRHLNGNLFSNSYIKNDLVPGDSVAVYTPLQDYELKNPRKEDIDLARKLINHLNDYLEYYHRLIWTNMDSNRRYMLLDGFIAPNSGGKSVASVVENKLLGIAGNSLVMPVARGYKLDPTYAQPVITEPDGTSIPDPSFNLLKHYEPVTPIEPYRLSVPTRGVFAEAIQGACNACEKKDDTRFWKWEESPIPGDPTAIQPINTDSRRADPGSMQAQDMPAPIVNIQNVPSAPDPSGISAALQLLGTPNAFRDATGLDQTQKNAIEALKVNADAAQNYTKEASKMALQASNMKNMDQILDKIKTARAEGLIDEQTSRSLTESALRGMIGAGSTPVNSNMSDIQQAHEASTINDQQASDLNEANLRSAVGDTSSSNRANDITDNPVVAGLINSAAQDGRNVSINSGQGSVSVTEPAPNESQIASKSHSATINCRTYTPIEADTFVANMVENFGVDFFDVRVIPSPIFRNWSAHDRTVYHFIPTQYDGHSLPITCRVLSSITQIVLHETVSTRWNVTPSRMIRLGLGIHFVVDSDGTMTQHNDVVDRLIHCSQHNANSVGIEFANIVWDSIHGQEMNWTNGAKYLVPSTLQLESLINLMNNIFLNVPNIPRDWVQLSYPPDDKVLFLMTRPGNGYGSSNQSGGIWCHAIEDGSEHADGRFLALYSWLRISVGLSATDAYSKIIEICTDASKAVSKNGAIYLDVTDIANSPA